MTDTTAKIRAKGLDSTGVTEQIANEMYAVKGRHYMAIVEMKVEELHEKADGTRKVDLVLTQVEPAVSEEMSEHLREITRTCYYSRGNGDQLTLTGHDEPTVEGVLAAGVKHKPHPFLPVDAADDNGICDVCGFIQAAGVHSTQEVLDDPEDDDSDIPGDDEAVDQAEDPEGWEEDPDIVDARNANFATVPDPFTTPA